MEPLNFDNMAFLGNMNSEFERYHCFPQLDDCPSMASSFLTVDTSGVSFDGVRNEHRGSISPENLTISSGASVNSPLTPAHFHEQRATAMWPKDQQSDIWNHQTLGDGSLWPIPEEVAMAQYDTNHFPQHDLFMHLPGYFGLHGRSKPMTDPSLSRAVFPKSISQQEEHCMVNDMMSWPRKLEYPYPRTIAPNVTLQDITPSSPASEFEPKTPVKRERYSSSILASSPLTRSSSSIATSQRSIDQEARFIPLASTPSYYEQEELSHFMSSPQNHHFQHEESSPIKPQISKSGVDCEAVIPQNIFACSFSGCVDKDGKPKRFRRQEHKKRHEKTVHNKDTSFACWVKTGGKPCNKVFTRRDNLNSHLKKTHGSRKNNQRNSYVATLDEKSKYFDEKWKGQLTADGLPIGHPRWPEVC